jgi:TetR/AcrR family transcriptional regulator, transcriptional repressor for nem operon
MRYSRQQKPTTRTRILASAGRLFAAKGFAAASIDDIMRDCGLTRGGFYAHFSSKSQLYSEAMGRQPLGAPAPVDDVEAVLNACLNPERLAFFATDVASVEPGVRSAYAGAFKRVSARLRECTRRRVHCSEESALSAAAMIVGALAVAHTADDPDLRKKLLRSCHEQAKALLEGGGLSAPLLFWAPGGE